MGAVALDTSVVIGFLHSDDSHHQASRRAISDARERGNHIVLPAIVLAETLVREYRMSDAAGDRLAVGLVSLFGPERMVDAEVARAAARLRARHRLLRMPDALVIATGMVDGATVLTCDRRWVDIDDRVRLLSAD